MSDTSNKKTDNEEYKIPQHVAIILDGNGRWAKKRLMPRNFGHKAGADNLEQVIEDAWDLGIKYLTVYAFSTENWKRSVEEVTGLMTILRDFLRRSIDKSMKNNMRVRVIGRRDRLDKDIIKAIEDLEEATKNNTGIQFNVALNYGGRDEITRAIQNIAQDVKDGKLDISDINEELVSSRLDTGDIPDPDLLIRTSGELRISNFLPWQISYSEFYFCDTLWPDFDKEALKKAIDYYNGRDRRFGGAEA
ncbi:MAG: isoprenyl transferase [Eubacterium sp.]|nr:isoprenyl transferase [Eubacterium sp.]